MNILVSGANGQLGQELREVSAIYPSWNFFFANRTELDICNKENLEAWISENNIDIFINTASYTAVDLAETEIEQATNCNATALIAIAEITAKYNTHLIHISTDYIFGDTSTTPYSETEMTFRPNSIYGKTKLEGERNILQYAKAATIIRTSWLYSAYGKNFVKTMMKLGAERKELSVVFDQIGSPTYAKDLAKAILAILHNLSPKVEIFHFSNEGVCSWYDFARKIMLHSALPCSISPIRSSQYPTPAKRPSYSVLDKTKFKQTFNFPILHWEDSLAPCLHQIQIKST